MSAAEVIWMRSALRRDDITAWIDGGWGVDALLGVQTREHDDLDLVVDTEAVATIRGVLEDAGFVVERDWLPTALALRHPDGRAVDLHPVELTPEGGGDQIQLDGVTIFHYSPPVTGTIDDRPVLCCSPQPQIDAHLGYPPDDDDRADMAELAKRYALALPDPYRNQPPTS